MGGLSPSVGLPGPRLYELSLDACDHPHAKHQLDPFTCTLTLHMGLGG